MKQHEEKAKELIRKFKRHAEHDWMAAGYSDYKSVEEVILLQAKQCALIAVDDRLEEIEISLDMDTFVTNTSLWNYQVDKQKYWQQVKESINKM